MEHIWLPGDLLLRLDKPGTRVLYVLRTSNNDFMNFYTNVIPLVGVRNDFYRVQDLDLYTDIFREIKNNTCE